MEVEGWFDVCGEGEWSVREGVREDMRREGWCVRREGRGEEGWYVTRRWCVDGGMVCGGSRGIV